MANLFTLWNWVDRQPCHHMYRLSSSSSPSIRTWDQPNGETLVHKSPHCKVTQINIVRGYWIDQFNGRWNIFGHPQEARKSRNQNSKFTESNHIWHRGCSILTEITDKTFHTGGLGLWNLQSSPRNVKSLYHVRICFGLYSIERYINSGGRTVIEVITRWPSGTVRYEP